MKKTILKICGIRDKETAIYCEKSGVDLIGLNFVPSSRRCIDLKMAKKIKKELSNIKTVAVFQDQKIDFVNNISEELDLDYIQLSGEETKEYIKQCNRPVIKGIKIKREEDLLIAEDYQKYVDLLLLDGPCPGSGKVFDWDILNNFECDFIIAGGINVKNIDKVLNILNPYGVDIASGVETDGEIDINKIQIIINKLKCL